MKSLSKSLSLRTSDGQVLAADLAGAEGERIAAAVLCHPHPLYGGSRHDAMVEALFTTLPAAGVTAVRFDFRAAHDGGVAERLDVVAALDALDALDDESGEATAVTGGARVGVPRFVVGYSFGAVVALTTTDPRIAGVVAIAPPLHGGTAPPEAPVLVLTPERDQFCPPPAARAALRGWPDCEHLEIGHADHFLRGHTAEIADLVARWMTGRANATP